MPKWKTFFNPDYLGAWAVDDGKDIVGTIASTGMEEVTGENGRKESCLVAHFREPNLLPMILNRTNCKSIAKLAGSNDTDNWPGTAIQIYVTQTKLKGDMVDCLRIRPYPPRIQQAVPATPCSDCHKPIQPDKGHDAAYYIGFSQKNFGVPLCAPCMRARKAAQKAAAAAAQESAAAEKQEVTTDA